MAHAIREAQELSKNQHSLTWCSPATQSMEVPVTGADCHWAISFEDVVDQIIVLVRGLDQIQF